jgi:hypothetical protein
MFREQDFLNWILAITELLLTEWILFLRECEVVILIMGLEVTVWIILKIGSILCLKYRAKLDHRLAGFEEE